MADLGTIPIDGFVNVTDVQTTGTAPYLEVIGSADDNDYVFDSTNSSHTGQCYFDLGTVPSDIASVTALNIRLRYRVDVTMSNITWDNLQARVYKSDGTTALTNLVDVATSITTTTATNSSVVPFTGVDTAATQADWDGARVYLYWVVTRTKGGGTYEKWVTAGEITGTYTAAAPAVTKTFAVFI